LKLLIEENKNTTLKEKDMIVLTVLIPAAVIAALLYVFKKQQKSLRAIKVRADHNSKR